jgi:hypothetical protein
MSLSKGYRPWSRVVDSELRIVPITFFDVATELIELGLANVANSASLDGIKRHESKYPSQAIDAVISSP